MVDSLIDYLSFQDQDLAGQSPQATEWHSFFGLLGLRILGTIWNLDPALTHSWQATLVPLLVGPH